jgi:hypothetical protein
MSHLNEEELILHYYGEEGDALAAEQHLGGCDECRAVYASLQRVLNVVDSLPIPARSAAYGAEVWERIQSQLPARRRWWALPVPWRWPVVATACASLMTAAFFAGRFYPHPQSHVQIPGHMAVAEPQRGERILLVAVGDYLERSQMVLIELANANPKGPLDITAERDRAADLVNESRFYRQTAATIGDTAVSSVLDDLDRVLLEISHSPAQLTPEGVQQLRHRLEAAGILFKIRVLGSNVRNQEEPRPEAKPSEGRQTL